MSFRALVADDDDAIRRALTASLTRAGFIVTAVDDGAPAIALGETAEFDMVIVDYHMKTVDGAEVVRYYKQRFGTAVYCAVLSGEDDETTRETFASAGVDEMFQKPISPVDLRRRLAEAMAPRPSR